MTEGLSIAYRGVLWAIVLAWLAVVVHKAGWNAFPLAGLPVFSAWVLEGDERRRAHREEGPRPVKPTRASTMPTFSEFRERLWQDTESRPLLDALDTMYDRLRSETLKAIDTTAAKKPDSGFTDLGAGRILSLRYEAVRKAVSTVFDRRRRRVRKVVQ